MYERCITIVPLTAAQKWCKKMGKSHQENDILLHPEFFSIHQRWQYLLMWRRFTSSISLHVYLETRTYIRWLQTLSWILAEAVNESIEYISSRLEVVLDYSPAHMMINLSAGNYSVTSKFQDKNAVAVQKVNWSRHPDKVSWKGAIVLWKRNRMCQWPHHVVK